MGEVWTSSFQGFEVNGTNLTFAADNNKKDKSFLYIEYFFGASTYITSNLTSYDHNVNEFFNKTMRNVSSGNFELLQYKSPAVVENNVTVTEEGALWRETFAKWNKVKDCSQIISSYSKVINFKVGGSKKIGLETSSMFYYNTGNESCVMMFAFNFVNIT